MIPSCSLSDRVPFYIFGLAARVKLTNILWFIIERIYLYESL